VSFGETVVLAALAGFTIFLGLPLGRLQIMSNRARVALAMFAVGILAFLFADIFEHALEIVEEPVEAFEEGEQGIGEAIGLVALLGVGFAAGTAGLATVERWMRPTGPSRPPVAGGSVDVLTGEDAERLEAEAAGARVRALQVGMTIAAAIGLHNFAEGLAIGVSASTGEIALATVLVIGFALHNATEGFGIVGPLGPVRPSWGWLGLAGLIGGGPVFVGAIVGYNVNSEPLELAFYGLAGGAIIYVIGEVWTGMRRYGHRELGLWMLAAGFLAGVITDLVVVYGGG
jgi:zinc transporter, ZIP family